MAEFFQAIFSILTTFPGNLTYHLVIAFAITGALYSAHNHWQTSEYPQDRRMVIGLGALLGIRILFFLAGLLISLGPAPFQSYLPPIARCVDILSLIIIIWLWAFPEPTQTGDVATIILSFITLIFFVITALLWSANFQTLPEPGAGPSFNSDRLLDPLWTLYGLILIGAGIVLLLVRRPNSWEIGSIMFLVLGTGYAWHLFIPDLTNNFSGVIRLSQLIAYPMLLVLPNRFPLQQTIKTEEEEPLVTVERRSYGAESETFEAFLELTTEDDPIRSCVALTKTISHIMLADISFLVVLAEEENEIIFECGYDLIREQGIPGATFNEKRMPLLSAAIHKGRTLKLPASSTSPDLQGLSHALGVDRVGHLMAVPIPPEDGYPLTGIVLLSPYSNRGWSIRDEDYLRSTIIGLIEIARKNQTNADQNQQMIEILEKLRLTELELEKAQEENESLQDQIVALDSAPAQDSEAVESLAALLLAHEEAQDTINQLQNELETLLRGAERSSNGNQEEEFFLGEPGQDEGIAEPLSHTGAVSPDEKGLESDQADKKDVLVSSIAMEMRQPMSSIIGYTDLLMSESVGILGSLQVKFMERIKASVERLRAMNHDLIQLTGESSELGAAQERDLVDLTEIIDDAISFTRSQLREKNIILRVDLPDHLPELRADRDAIQQILIHLLQNAGSVTPVEGEMALHAKLDQEIQESHILLQVSDSGGGIPEDDLPRVFSRIYQAENTLIEGIGDTGVGLAMAKSLAESQGGDLWVETTPGEGSTFSVFLPVVEINFSDEEAGGPAQ